MYRSKNLGVYLFTSWKSILLGTVLACDCRPPSRKEKKRKLASWVEISLRSLHWDVSAPLFLTFYPPRGQFPCQYSNIVQYQSWTVTESYLSIFYLLVLKISKIVLLNALQFSWQEFIEISPIFTKLRHCEPIGTRREWRVTISEVFFLLWKMISSPCCALSRVRLRFFVCVM